MKAPSPRSMLITVCVLCSLFNIGCSNNSDGGNGSTTAPFQELYDQGVDRYLGVFTPMASDALEGGVTEHSFGDGDGNNERFFRGIQNLSASLDVIARTYPVPTRILLAGNSAGGTGVHYALPLIRKLYPQVPIELVHDSDPGIREPGSQESLNDYWNSAAFFPASCSNCIGDDGNLTGYYEYQLAEDDNVRMGFISSTRDNVITGSSGISAPAFEAQLLAAMIDLEEAYPERFRSLVSDTDEHTYIIKQFDFAIGDTTVRQWVADMLSLIDDWVSKSA